MKNSLRKIFRSKKNLMFDFVKFLIFYVVVRKFGKIINQGKIYKKENNNNNNQNN